MADNTHEYNKRKRRAMEIKARQFLEHARKQGNYKATYSQAEQAAREVAEHHAKVTGKG